MKLFLGVLGEQNGQQKLREAFADAVFFDSNFVTLPSHATVRAATDSVIENMAVPTTLQKGGIHRLAASYSDTFGGTSIKSPSLALTQQGTSFGHIVQLTRAQMTVTDDKKVCLVAANENKCAPLAQGGTLVAGGVTVEVGETKADLPVGNTRVVTWAFSLGPNFPSDSFTLVAAADDADPFRYVIVGQAVPQPINLLPWKSLNLPITVP
jgi:hypothetical protein